MKKLLFGLIATVMFGATVKAQTQIVSKFYLVTCDDWGRASLKCGGWGLCNAEWFHCSPDPCFGKSNSAPLQFDPKNNIYFIDILPDNETLVKYSNEDLSTLPVDLDITLSTKEVVGRDLIIQKGIYPINEETKSYRIYLK